MKMKVSLTSCLLLLSMPALAAGPMLQITPTVFDFGWCPDNAKISANFDVHNIGEGIVPLTAVQPTCGCTAPNFTPANLGTNEHSTIGLTFNTRGYNGLEFNKATKVKTDMTDQEYTVNLKGAVANNNAKLLPTGNGVAAFEPGTSEKKKTVRLNNKSDKDLTLQVVQQPAEWAQAKLAADVVKAGGSVDLEVRTDPPFDDLKETSITIAGTGDAVEHRVTIAIRTGLQPTFKKLAPAAATPQAVPAEKK